MENLTVNLDKAKLICSGNLELDKDFKIDSFTTINLSGYYRYLDLNNKSLLTIGKSADEVFNGVFFGAKDITLVEKNPLIIYYYYLKLAGLLTLSYKEFEWFFHKYLLNKHPNNKMFSKKLYRKIKPELLNINSDSYCFFTELLDKYNSRVVRDKLFNDSGYHRKTIRSFDIYLRNEDAYNKTRDTIKDVNITYINSDLLTSKVDLKYDIINLSSLCTKTTIYKLSSLIKKLDNNNLTNDGTIVLGYLWNNNMYTEEYPNVWQKIYDNPWNYKFISKYISEVLEVSSYRDILWEDNKREDRVLIYHKNKDH